MSTAHILKVAKSLFESEEERSAFVDQINAGSAGKSVLLHINEAISLPSDWNLESKPTWAPDFVKVVGSELRPGSHPLHDDGVYYCLDLSSVFMASVLTGIEDTPRVVFDACSSPGGKAVFAWKFFSPELLISNDSIGKRIPALISNLKRCNIQPSYVSSIDSDSFPSRALGVADMVIVDAPCSGQSLPMKGEKSAGAFHPATINLNSNRQKRILANAASVVAEGGSLAYMTCTFSIEENEKVISWFLKKFPEYASVEVPGMNSLRSTLSDHFCYRLFPKDGFGAGGFTSLFKRIGDRPEQLSEYSGPIAWQHCQT